MLRGKLIIGLGALLIAGQAMAGLAVRSGSANYSYSFMNKVNGEVDETTELDSDIVVGTAGLSLSIEGLFVDFLVGTGVGNLYTPETESSYDPSIQFHHTEMTAVVGIKGGGLSIYGGWKFADRSASNGGLDGYITNYVNGPLYEGWLAGAGYGFNFGWFMPSLSFNYMWGTSLTGTSIYQANIGLLEDDLNYENTAAFTGFSGAAKVLWPIWIFGIAPKFEFQTYGNDRWEETYIGTGVDLMLNF